MQHEHIRTLPHIYKTGVNIFITFRLHNSIPQVELKKLIDNYELSMKMLYSEKLEEGILEAQKNEIQKQHFENYDLAMHNNEVNQHLKNVTIAKLVCNALKFHDEKEYNIICYTVMPNHVHFLFNYLDNAKKGIDKIMQSIKGFTAREANKILGKKGQFWQHESYDHIIRDENDLKSTMNYIIMNPCMAGLIKSWDKWPYTFIGP